MHARRYILMVDLWRAPSLLPVEYLPDMIQLEPL